MATRPDYPGAGAWLPGEKTLPAIATALPTCEGCDLASNGTRPVPGTGNPNARCVFVGEQPGDVEEQRGLPFVGPAGKLFDRALAEAGIDRADTWVTNSVKHFRFTLAGNGKRRIHQTPDTYEVAACKPWLLAELDRVRPSLVVLLGATAAKGLLGSAFRVTQQRGVLLQGPEATGAQLLATIHPSAVLRADPASRDEAFNGLVSDLRVAAAFLAGSSAPTVGG